MALGSGCGRMGVALLVWTSDPSFVGHAQTFDHLATKLEPILDPFGSILSGQSHWFGPFRSSLIRRFAGSRRYCFEVCLESSSYWSTETPKPMLNQGVNCWNRRTG